MEVFINRRDAYGEWSSGKWTARRQPLTDETIDRHKRGETVIGCYTTAPDNTCRWVCLDFDEGSDTETLARDAVRRFAARGLPSHLEESRDGRFHVWVFFDAPIPSESAHTLAREVGEGLGCECFPKQPRLTGADGLGNFVRLPGRHPKTPDWWSRWWDASGGGWVECPDLFELLDDLEAADSALAPAPPPTPDARPSVSLPSRAPDLPAGIAPAPVETDAADFLTALQCLEMLPRRYREDYDDWLRVGMALHDLESSHRMLMVWEEWSRKCQGKYEPGACAAKWQSFKRCSGPRLGLGSLIRWAGLDSSVRALERMEQAEREAEPGSRQADSGGPPDQQALGLLREATGLPIQRWIKRGVEAGAEVYYMRLEGVDHDIQIGDAAAVHSQTTFRARVYGQTDRAFQVPAKRWTTVLAWLGRIVEIEAIDESTREGRMASIMESYIGSYPPLSNREQAVPESMPFIEGDMVFVSLPRLEEFLAVHRRSVPKLAHLMSAVGGKSQHVRGGGSARRYWSFPLDSYVIPEEVRQKCAP